MRAGLPGRPSRKEVVHSFGRLQAEVGGKIETIGPFGETKFYHTANGLLAALTDAENQTTSFTCDDASQSRLGQAGLDLETGGVRTNAATNQRIESAVMGPRRPNIRWALPRRKLLGLYRRVSLRICITA